MSGGQHRDDEVHGPSRSKRLPRRTFLAWIRTSLALMGFGFVVARFGIFLQQVRLAESELSGRSFGLSIWFGTALIAAGVVVDFCLVASLHGAIVLPWPPI